MNFSNGVSGLRGSYRTLTPPLPKAELESLSSEPRGCAGLCHLMRLSRSAVTGRWRVKGPAGRLALASPDPWGQRGSKSLGRQRRPGGPTVPAAHRLCHAARAGVRLEAGSFLIVFNFEKACGQEITRSLYFLLHVLCIIYFIGRRAGLGLIFKFPKRPMSKNINVFQNISGVSKALVSSWFSFFFFNFTCQYEDSFH